MADKIASARRLRGKVYSRLTQIEKDIGKFEEKEGLTPTEERKIQRLKELVKEGDRDFEPRARHVQVLNLIKAEDKGALGSEQTVIGELEDCVTDIIERLEKLENMFTCNYRACDASCIR